MLTKLTNLSQPASASHSSRMRYMGTVAAQKIKVQNPLVELDGDEVRSLPFGAVLGFCVCRRNCRS